MTMNRVMVPSALLMASGLSKSAKFVWMLLQLPPEKEGGRRRRPGHLHFLAGIARSTVRAAQSELERGRWLTTSPRGSRVKMPVELLTRKRLDMQAKLLYGVLQLTPGFHEASGHYTHASLSALAGVSLSTAKRALRTLCLAGWLQVAEADRSGPIQFTLRDPATDRYNHAVAAIKRRYHKSDHKGETLMREYLSRIIASDEYDDDASPSFLLNPYTGAEMQFDRYYPPTVAFEFQGAQHFGATELYPDEDAVRKQRLRDHMKAGICKDRGIRLILVHAEDLNFATLLKKVDGLLPLRDLSGSERVIAYLDRRSRAYRKKAAK